MADLEVALLAQNAQLCFEFSRDNATFDLAQRNIWMNKGFEQKARLIELVGKKMAAGFGPEVVKANTKLAAINQRLKDKQKSLSKFSETIQMINDALSILDTFIGLVIPGV